MQLSINAENYATVDTDSRVHMNVGSELKIVLLNQIIYIRGQSKTVRDQVQYTFSSLMIIVEQRNHKARQVIQALVTGVSDWDPHSVQDPS